MRGLKIAYGPQIQLQLDQNGGVKYLLCVIYVFNKYAWLKPLKDKKAKTDFNGFIVNVNQMNYGLIKEKILQQTSAKMFT